jgi:hypothetical protein
VRMLIPNAGEKKSIFRRALGGRSSPDVPASPQKARMMSLDQCCLMSPRKAPMARRSGEGSFILLHVTLSVAA